MVQPTPMRESDSLPMPKWPFFLGDAAMFGLAWFIYYESKLPLGEFQLAACSEIGRAHV